MSRLDHPTYFSRRDDASSPLGESTTGRARLPRTAPQAGAPTIARGRTSLGGPSQPRPPSALWLLVGLALMVAGVVACHTDADGSPLCAEVSCEVTP